MNFAKFLLGLVLTSLLFSKEYLAVVDFSANNVSNSNVNALTQRLISSLIVLDKYQIIERSEMNKLLDEQKFQSSGCTSTQCAVDIGKLIGAKYVVVGSVGKIGSTYAVDARIIDVETGEALSSASYSHYGEIDQLLIEGIDQITAQLCGLEYKKEDLVLNASNGIDVSSKKNKKFNYFALGYVDMLSLIALGTEANSYIHNISIFHLRPKALKNLQFKMHSMTQRSSYESTNYFLETTYQDDSNEHSYESTTYMAFGYFLPIKRISKLSFSGNAWLYMRIDSDSFDNPDNDNIPSAFFAELSVQIETPKFLSFGLRPELGLRADFDRGGLSLFFAIQFIEFSFGSNY